MEIDKVIISSNGWAIDVDSIRALSAIEVYESRAYVFYLHYKGSSDKHSFFYPWDRYADTKEELFVKIVNIRNEIIKMMNDGRDARILSGNIKLKKT